MTSITGFEELAEELEDAADELRRVASGPITEAADNAIDSTKDAIILDAKRNAPVDEGLLRALIMEDTESAHILYRRIVARAEYSRATEYGRGHVTILPKEKKAMKFIAADGDEIIVSKVEQEPRAAQPFLRPAIASNRSTLRRELRREVREVFRRVSLG